MNALGFLSAAMAASLAACLLACTESEPPTGADAKADTVLIKDTLLVYDTTEASEKGVGFEVRFHPVFGSAPFKIGSKYLNAAGDSAWFTLARFYASEFCLVDSQGVPHASPGLAMIDFADGKAESQGYYAFRTKAVPGIYRGIKFSVGVPYALNHTDPAGQSLPLGPNSGMFWSWNSGYIFHRVEGKVDSSGKPVSFFYHIGTDNRKQTVSLYTLPDPMMAGMGMPMGTTTLEVGKDGGSVLSIDVDYAAIFSKGLDGSNPLRAAADTTERVAHGGPLADRVFLNMQSMFKSR